MSSKKYIVYETTNLINGKYYIGVHKVNGTNYLGSGKILLKAIKKYGNDKFIRDILKEFDNEQDAYNFEQKIVNIDLINNISCYNIVEGGGNPPTLFGNDNFMVSIGHKIHPMQGKKHKESSKKKISNSLKGRIPHNRKSWIIYGKWFKSSLEASNYFECSDWTIRSWCKQNIPHCYSYN